MCAAWGLAVRAAYDHWDWRQVVAGSHVLQAAELYLQANSKVTVPVFSLLSARANSVNTEVRRSRSKKAGGEDGDHPPECEGSEGEGKKTSPECKEQLPFLNVHLAPLVQGKSYSPWSQHPRWQKSNQCGGVGLEYAHPCQGDYDVERVHAAAELGADL